MDEIEQLEKMIQEKLSLNLRLADRRADYGLVVMITKVGC